MATDERRTQYRQAVNRLKDLKQGTPEWEKNAARVQNLGDLLGLKWQDDLPASYVAKKPVTTQPVTSAPASNRGSSIYDSLGLQGKLGNSPAPTAPTPAVPAPNTPAAPAPTPVAPTPFTYGYQAGDEVIVRKGLSGVNLTPEEGRRYQQIAYHDLIPNASTIGERKQLMLGASQSVYKYGNAEGVPGPTEWSSIPANNPNIIPPNFDLKAYVAANPDIAAAGVDPLLHFLETGVYENRVFTVDGKRSGEYFDSNGTYIQPKTEEPTTTTPTTTTTTSPTENESPLDKALLQKAIANLYPSEMGPVDGSALYKFQKGEGEASLQKLMAARGLTGSGAEIEANSKFLNQLGAEESQRQQQFKQNEDQLKSSASQYVLGLNSEDQRTAMDFLLKNKGMDQDLVSSLMQLNFNYKNLDSQNANSDADRELTASNYAAQNALTQSNSNFRNYLDWINSGYSQSPYQGAIDAAAGLGENAVNRGNATSKIVSSIYNRPTQYMATGGSGGGSGYSPQSYAPYIPPSSRPTSANMNMSNTMGIFGNAASNTGYANVFNNAFSGLFSGNSGKSSLF